MMIWIFRACGFDNCAVISEDGKLYVWGGNDYNKLGIGSDEDFETQPTMVDSLTVIKTVYNIPINIIL